MKSSQPGQNSFCQEYLSEGYVIVREVFPLQEILQIRKASDELSNTAKTFTHDTHVNNAFFGLHRDCNPFSPNVKDQTPVPGMLQRVTYPYLISDLLNKARQNQNLIDIAKILLGGELVQIVNQINFNQSKRGSGWGWHQDYAFRKAGLNDPRRNFVQSVTAIDSSSKRNGGISVIPRSDALGPLALEKNQEQVQELVDLSTAITPELEPGDVIFFNPYVVHGSSGNSSDSPRRVYINGYARADACSYGLPLGKADNGFCMEYENEPKLTALNQKS